MARERDFGPVQLADWLGLEPRTVRRAQARGLIPPPDIDDERWSLGLAKTIPDRLVEITAAFGDGEAASGSTGSAPKEPRRAGAAKGRSFGPYQLAGRLGLENWQIGRGQQKGVVPPPDVDGKRWSEAVADMLAGRVEEIRATVGDHPGVGSVKAAEHLASRTGLEVDRVDVQALAGRGLLEPVGTFKEHPMYSLDDLDGLPAEEVGATVREREDWLAASMTGKEAAAYLGWPLGTFEVTAERGGVRAGRLGRYARTDVDGLREDA
ncbi:hypothetical protein ACWGJ2_13545 [Streptomyces sp. NPDC054796]